MGASSQPMSTVMIDDLYSKRIHNTLRNIASPRQDLTFAQLKIYYQERGLELNEKFANWKNFFSRLGTDIFFCYRENIILKTLKLPMSKGNE